MKGMNLCARAAMAATIILGVGFAGCAKGPKYDTNLLKNGSFEEVGRDGVPKGWKLVLFHGSPDQPGVRYGSDSLAVDGKKSWFFQVDPGTRRWYSLQQEVKLTGASHVRVGGWIAGDDVRMMPEQYAMCNLLLTFYDKNHHRFEAERPADRRTPLRSGTFPWEEQTFTFSVPEGTHYVAVSCLLACNGEAWFDNVSLQVPKPVKWETATTKNYVFHWLPGHPMPPGATDAQQGRFDNIAGILGVMSDVVINYYFYPDSLTIQKMNGVKGDMYINWDEHEVHTLRPFDDHQVVHFITDPYGRPPKALAEGTVLWIRNRCFGRSLDEQLADVVQANKITPIIDLVDYTRFEHTDTRMSIPTAAAFVKWLVEKWGNAKLMDLYGSINGMNAYNPVANGFEAVYGVPLAKAEDEFRTWMYANYGKSAAKK